MINKLKIKYTIKKSKRSRNVRIAVNCDSTIVVTVPFWFANYKIEKILKEKEDWILKKIEYFSKNKNIVRLSGGKIEYLKNKEKVRKIVKDKIIKLNNVYNFKFSRISIKNHKTRWGSCSQKGNLNFNYKIIFLPDYLMEYIIVHELCHLKEFNHSKNFWALVGEHLPDYNSYKRELKRYTSR